MCEIQIKTGPSKPPGLAKAGLGTWQNRCQTIFVIQGNTLHVPTRTTKFQEKNTKLNQDYGNYRYKV